MREFVRHQAGIPLRIYHQDSVHDFIMLNVSLGGFACLGSVKIDINQEVKIEIPVLKPPYVGRGRIVWCKKNDDLFEIGIENTGSRDRTCLNMVEQISHIEHYRREINEAEGRELSGEEAALEWTSTYGGS